MSPLSQHCSDPLGHHAARHGGDVVTRHNVFGRRTHLSVRVEVGYGLSRNQSPSLVYIPLSMGT